MEIKYFQDFQKLAAASKVQRLICNNDSSHPLLYASFDENDEIILKCRVCLYRLIPGLSLYEFVKEIVEHWRANERL